MKKYYIMLPILFFYVLLGLFFYIAIVQLITGDVNIVFDWAQDHTALFVLLIWGAAVILWLLTVYVLDRKQWTKRITGSTYHAIFTAVVLSIGIGMAGSIIFLLYHIDPQEIGKTVEWMQERPERYLLSSFILGLITFGLILLIGEVYFAAGLAFLLFSIIAIANYYKRNFREEPLFPNDFVQLNQLGEILPFIRDYISLPLMIIISLCLAATIAIWFFYPKVKIHLIARIVLIIPILFLLKSFLLFEDTFAHKYYQDYAELMPWNQIINYRQNGPIIGMISNIKVNLIDKPEDYSEKEMEKVIKRISSSIQDENSGMNNFEKPNIVFYMNETFWDPMELDLQFSEDPLENFRDIQRKNPSGSILSSEFGGNTANVEFEALTGFSMNFFNPGGIPFSHILANDTFPSIASYLGDMGYYTEAIHPNGGNLYRRDRVYANLGFQKSTFIDDMTYTEKDNKDFVSDESVVNEVLDSLQHEEEPAFIHAVTIANHLPYNGEKYENGSTISVEAANLAPESKERVEVYSEGIKRSDQAIERFVEQLNTLDEPTLLVIWGDHLPTLGPNLQVYKEAGFGNEEDQQTDSKFYQTPLTFIAANFEFSMEEPVEVISPIYLGPLIVDALGFDKNLFYHYLEEMEDHIPALRKGMYITDHENMVDRMEQLPKDTKRYLKDYHKLQYDILTGKQHTFDSLYE